MNVNEIKDEDLNLINAFSEQIQFYNKSSKGKQKLCRMFAEDIADLPSELSAMFTSKNVSDEEFFEFISDCSEEYKRRNEIKEQAFEEMCAQFNTEAQNALLLLYDSIRALFFSIENKKNGGEVEIIIDEYANRIAIVLENASGLDSDIEEVFDDVELIKDEDGQFILHLLFTDMDNDEGREISIKFTDIRVKKEKFNFTDNIPQAFSSWDIIYYAAVSLVYRHEKFDFPINSKEAELIPLMKEICATADRSQYPESTDFTELTKLLERHGASRAVKLLKKLKKLKPYTSRYEYTYIQFQNELCDIKNEPLWRELWGRLCDSQKDYPTRPEALCPKETLEKARRRISNRLKLNGYKGEYPDFVKVAPLKGMHIIESYSMTYNVFTRRPTYYHIHCSEEYFGNKLQIVLAGGFDIRKNNEKGDIFTCMMNSKGHTHYYTTPILEPQDNLELFADIAVKRAELKKLTKKEKRVFVNYGKGVNPFANLLAGLFFAVFMTAAFILMAAIALKSFKEGLSLMPWKWVFIFCWVSFSVCMTLANLFKR